VYFPLAQSIFPFAPGTFAVRSTRRAADLAPLLRQAVRETAPGIELVSVASFSRFMEEPLAQPRVNAVLLGLFAAAALALAAVGLLGVMMTSVQHRRQELGVRMALGATAANLRRLVLGRGFIITVSGTLAGVLVALAGNRLLGGLLYGVTPTDAPTLLASAIVLLTIAMVACAIPAWAATRIDPVIAMRAEG
jgi:putative ABC transport system permease protein